MAAGAGWRPGPDRNSSRRRLASPGPRTIFLPVRQCAESGRWRQRVDFTSEAFFRDPGATVAALRATAPVVATRFPIVGKVWVTTTHEATARVLKDSATFTLRKDGGDVAGLRWWMPASVAAIANNMLTMDEPDHTRLRGIVDEAFRRRAVVDMEPRIRSLADDLADKLFADRDDGGSRRALRADPAAVGDFRVAGPSASRPADLYRLGQ